MGDLHHLQGVAMALQVCGLLVLSVARKQSWCVQVVAQLLLAAALHSWGPVAVAAAYGAHLWHRRHDTWRLLPRAHRCVAAAGGCCLHTGGTR